MEPIYAAVKEHQWKNFPTLKEILLAAVANDYNVKKTLDKLVSMYDSIANE
jgi:hypothetical protein